MSCGLSVNGFARPEELMLKAGLQPGELMILTRPLGSGVLFAADMQGKARGAWIDEALEQMLVSNRAAAACFRQFKASACTDVTGFGLAGHLFEMARASACAVEILIDRIPLYTGAASLANRGITSSLQPQNIRIRQHIDDTHRLASDTAYPLLFDPQTAGGLLAGIPPQYAEPCLQQLRDLGYPQAQIVARVTQAATAERIISLVNS
jgi:selenide,water dikinase